MTEMHIFPLIPGGIGIPPRRVGPKQRKLLGHMSDRTMRHPYARRTGASRAAGVLAASLMAALLAMSLTACSVQGERYRTARSLHNDCAAEAAQKQRRCTDYINNAFNNWILSQDTGICSHHVGAELVPAYLQYWDKKGLGLITGTLTSARSSVNEFLDSQKETCPVSDLKAHPY